MTLKAGGFIEVLESAMNLCCNQHVTCKGCVNLAACMSLWDQASEQATTKALTLTQVQGYIERFNQLREPETEDERVMVGAKST
jgi:hypothetical protein